MRKGGNEGMVILLEVGNLEVVWSLGLDMFRLQVFEPWLLDLDK